MSAINWTEEVAKRKDDLIRDTQQFLQIKSVWEEESAKEGAPFGEGVEKALSFMLHKGETEGFTSKNLEGYAGHLEMGQGEELVVFFVTLTLYQKEMVGRLLHIVQIFAMERFLHVVQLTIKAQRWQLIMR